VFLRRLVFPALEVVSRSRFWSDYRAALAFERQGDAERARVRDRRLRAVLRAASATALHRGRLAEAGPGADGGGPLALLGRLRPAGKDAYRRHFPGGVVTPGRAGEHRYVATSGTLDRMTVVTDFAKRDRIRSAELRVLHTALGADVAVPCVEVPPNACNAVCGLADGAPHGLRAFLWHALRRRSLVKSEARSDLRGRLERRVVLPRTTLPPLEPAPPAALAAALDGVLDRVAALRPAVLRAYPLYLLWLADRARAAGRALPGLRLLCPFGGLTSPRMVERCTAGFGAPFAGVYGTSELGSVAASCDRGPGMHVFEDDFVVEVLRGGRPAAPGEVGRLVVTDLTNRAMPLVRYDVGDVGRLLTGPCPCGRRTARLEVLGRVQEVLAAPAGPLTPSAVADTFFADPAVANFRLEERSPGSFEATLVPGGGAAPDVEAWKERFAALHGGVGRLRARVASFVRPEASGKYRLVLPRQEGCPL
jgi:phenylacetate-CoA ligase